MTTPISTMKEERDYVVDIKVEAVDKIDEFSTDLYLDHEIMEDMVIGPEVLQKRVQNKDEPIVDQFITKSDEEEPCSINQRHCILCDRLFAMYLDLEIHMQSHNECTSALDSVRTKDQVLCDSFKKKIIHHKNKKKSRFSCGICSNQFSNKFNLLRHSEVHTELRPFPCHICDKKYKNRYRLDQHLTTHTRKTKTINTTRQISQETFSCDICDQQFSYKSNLKRHYRQAHETLTKSRPFLCEICNKSFTRNCHLKNHLLIHTNRKTFSCEICGMKFSNEPYLRQHSQVHKQGKPFKCDICELHFTRKWNLNVHLLTHTNAKLLSCHICGMKFRYKKKLDVHFATHEQSRLFQCDICNMQFCKKTLLRSHLLVHSKGVEL